MVIGVADKRGYQQQLGDNDRYIFLLPVASDSDARGGENENYFC